MALTPKQSMFVKEYLVDLNATQAAIRAGYSVKTAEVIGYENLRKPQIESEIQLAMDARAERVESEADWVLRTIRETMVQPLVSWSIRSLITMTRRVIGPRWLGGSMIIFLRIGTWCSTQNWLLLTSIGTPTPTLFRPSRVRW